MITISIYKCNLGIKDLPVPTKWSSEGISLSLFPYPVTDKKRNANKTDCKQCANTCFGHYVTDIKEYVKLYSEGKAIRSLPPSQIINEFYRENKDGDTSNEDIEKLAQKCLLAPSDVKLWLDHLKQVTQNRKQGAKKAKVTRQKNKSKR